MSDKKLQGRKVLMVIAPDQFRDEELLEPKEVLVQAGAQVTVASTEDREAAGMLGARVRPDATIDTVKASDFHCVIVVGGMGSPEYLWNDAKLHRILTECHHQGKVVAGICLSGAALANAGVLLGRKATVWPTPESMEALIKGQAQYIKQPVVVDGNVVTADGPEAARAFGIAVADAMLKVGAKAV